MSSSPAQMTRYAIYTRQSVDKGDEFSSFEVQFLTCPRTYGFPPLLAQRTRLPLLSSSMTWTPWTFIVVAIPGRRGRESEAASRGRAEGA